MKTKFEEIIIPELVTDEVLSDEPAAPVPSFNSPRPKTSSVTMAKSPLLERIIHSAALEAAT
jgi:hypothetical protein